jgi:prevent-host-death family protein
MAYEIPVTQARAEFADLVNRVVYGAERVVLTRHGKSIVALVSAADLERLEALDTDLEADGGGQRPATVVRLSTDAPVRSAAAGPPARRPFNIAAEHRPLGRKSDPR